MRRLRDSVSQKPSVSNEPVKALLLITLKAGGDVDNFMRKLASDTEVDSIYVLDGAPDLLVVMSSESLDGLRGKVNNIKCFTDFRNVFVLPVHAYLDCMIEFKGE